MYHRPRAEGELGTTVIPESPLGLFALPFKIVGTTAAPPVVKMLALTAAHNQINCCYTASIPRAY